MFVGSAIPGGSDDPRTAGRAADLRLTIVGRGGIFPDLAVEADTLSSVERALAPGGMLLVGGAESLWGLPQSFETVRLDGALRMPPR